MINCPSNFKGAKWENKVLSIKYMEWNKMWR